MLKNGFSYWPQKCTKTQKVRRDKKYKKLRRDYPRKTRKTRIKTRKAQQSTGKSISLPGRHEVDDFQDYLFSLPLISCSSALVYYLDNNQP